MVLNKTHFVALATGCVLSFFGELEDVEDALECNRCQPESAVRARKCDKTEPTELAKSPRLSMRFDEQIRTVRSSGTSPRRGAGFDIDAVTSFDRRKTKSCPAPKLFHSMSREERLK